MSDLERGLYTSLDNVACDWLTALAYEGLSLVKAGEIIFESSK